jgi:hypothetical protein
MRFASRSPSPALVSALAATAALGALAGCFRSSGTAAPGPSNATPAGAAPRIGWGEHAFTSTGLPAVSADGTAVWIGLHDGDGGRGNPNYRVIIKDRADAETSKHVVITADEAEGTIDANGKPGDADKRIAAANAWLAEQHAARKLVPLVGLGLDSAGDITENSRAIGADGVTVEWKQNRVKITQHGTTLVDRATPDTWLAADHPMYAGAGGDEICHNPAFLDGAAVDVQRKLAVLVISYSGTDSCWEPSAAHHVVAW